MDRYKKRISDSNLEGYNKEVINEVLQKMQELNDYGKFMNWIWDEIRTARWVSIRRDTLCRMRNLCKDERAKIKKHENKWQKDLLIRE